MVLWAWAGVKRVPRALNFSLKSRLTPRFIHGYGDAVRQVQAAAVGDHRQPQLLLGAERVEQRHRQPAALRPEQQHVLRRETRFAIAMAAACGECPKTAAAQPGGEGGPV